MASRQGKALTRCADANWLDGKTAVGSHRTLAREGWPDFVFGFHDGEEIGPRMLARIAKHTGITPADLE